MNMEITKIDLLGLGFEFINSKSDLMALVLSPNKYIMYDDNSKEFYLSLNNCCCTKLNIETQNDIILAVDLFV